MFKNAGKKLGILIKISFFIHAISAFIIPFFIISVTKNGAVTFVCLIFALVMPFIYYILHLIIYAFAELCENVYDTKELLKDKIPNMNEDIFFLSKNIYDITKAMNLINEKEANDVNNDTDNPNGLM